jgi:hypothetical protein
MNKVECLCVFQLYHISYIFCFLHIYFTVFPTSFLCVFVNTCMCIFGASCYMRKGVLVPSNHIGDKEVRLFTAHVRSEYMGS